MEVCDTESHTAQELDSLSRPLPNINPSAATPALAPGPWAPDPAGLSLFS